jgi:DNA-binding transcriptional LysR family regulator
MAVRIGRLPDSSIIATTIGSMRRVICGSPELLASCGVPRTLSRQLVVAAIVATHAHNEIS